jgi:hypothetical protein
MNNPHNAPARRNWPLAAAAALLAATIAGCGQFGEWIRPTAPAVSGEWMALLGEIREFERSIGFVPTANFSRLAGEQAAFPFCGHTSRLALPWSYEDPAIQWRNAGGEEECRAFAPDEDSYFRKLEAQGESDTPVTGAMLAGKLDRFVYLVIHEDCHDQFALPYGVEETLCDFVTHQAMSAFADMKYGLGSREQRSIRRYAEHQAALARATIDWYGRLETLYARHQRGEIGTPALLRERAAVLASAEQPLAFGRGELNNVSLASNMTYSRYYPQMEDIFDAHGRDLARTVAFFRKADAAKPQAESVRKLQRLDDTTSADFLRTYEKAVMDSLRR